MSYEFVADDHLRGTFTTGPSQPVTLAAFVKVTTHPINPKTILQIGPTAGSNANSTEIRTSGVDDSWVARADNTENAQVITNVDGVWTAIVGVFTSNTLRDIYVTNLATTGTNTVTVTVNSAMGEISVGEAQTDTGDFVGLIAELAVWDVALTSGQITDYMAGTPASSIDPTNLIGYWPLSASSATQSNLGVDSGGDLTVTGAFFNSDHPTIGGSGATVTPNTAGMAV